MFRRSLSLLVLVLGAASASAAAQQNTTGPVIVIDPLLVNAERTYSAASSTILRRLDLLLRPRDSSQRLLSLAPGLFIAQHAGGGKAEQIFLRGFDADHGTDVAVTVDGIPVNMVSHAHGQGYADLHFLRPELVELVEVRKGGLDARDGDFATAGAVNFRTVDRLPGGSLQLRSGSFGARDAFVGLPVGSNNGFAALGLQRTEGPFEQPQDHKRINGFFRWNALPGGVPLRFTASAFDASWDASGQVPQRAVDANVIGRFGAIDPTEGGHTSRYDLAATMHSKDDARINWEASAFVTRYNFRLFSNFTFFLNDTINGDGIEQADRRWLSGVRAQAAVTHKLFGSDALSSAGASFRHDQADVGLFNQRARSRLGTRTHDDISQSNVSAWAKTELERGPARLQLGTRVDGFRFVVEDRTSEFSGESSQAIVSPKASLNYAVGRHTNAFAGFGYGFHSNDARDVVRGEGQRTLPRSRTAELGARHSWEGGTLAMTGWLTDLQSELVYVGDEGVTEPSGASRRVGIDADARFQLIGWLWADADVTLSRGRFRDEPDGANLIPLAPTLTATGGLTARRTSWSGGVRYRAVGSRPANEDNSVRARGATIWETYATWKHSRVQLSLAIDNLFDRAWNEAQFATTSRLRGERIETTELHFTPGAPRSLVIGATVRF